MSLVELALKKMQSARGATDDKSPARSGTPHPQTVPPVQVLGEVVPRSTHGRIDGASGNGKMVRIDQAALRVARLAPPESQQRELADQYRHIKRPLIGAATGRGANKLPRGQLIMMASAMPGEGKTFTAINLALSMALEKDVSVLLVDADVAKPHISRLFGLEREPGLLNVLRDPASNVESVILPTDVPNLSLLPAGDQSDTATELLASQRMEQTFQYLASSDPNRVILVDSPPLLLTSESRVLAHWVGQVVIVVRADFTPQQAVLDAVSHLKDSHSISLVLNQCKISTSSYYGYGSPVGGDSD